MRRCVRLRSLVNVSARQERINGWDQRALAGATVLMAGAGGLGSAIGEGLVQKGVGVLHLSDHDIVTPTNLNRQAFDRKSLYHNKAQELARILSGRGFLGTLIVAHPCSIQEVSLETSDA
ncbi:MAG: ThiF family adenylyltransferase [Phycisphaerae bacterium]|nr:ThiF family adenylyltransferase [Phycisphaerae bacterium]